MAAEDHIGIVEFDLFQRGTRPRELTYLEAEALEEEIENRRREIYSLLGRLIFCLSGAVTTRVSSEVNPRFPYVLSERIRIAMVGEGKKVEDAHEAVGSFVQGIVLEMPEWGKQGSSRF